MDNAEDEIEQEQIRDRYASLTGGVATIRIQSATDQDTNELKLRIEDAVNATRSAMEEGIVSGGGVALMEAALETMTGDTNGDLVMSEACFAPIRQILKNAGIENADELISKFKKGQGINVLTDKVVNMIESGIIDPLKVIRHSLKNAVSVSGLLLTSEYAVTNEERDVDAVRDFFKPLTEK